MPNDAQIARMRARVNTRLPDTAQIQRQVLVTDSHGGRIPSDSSTSWPVLYSGVACRLEAMGGLRRTQELGFGARQNVIRLHMLTFAWDVDVQFGDRVVVNNRTFEISNVSKDGAYVIDRTAECVEVQ